MTVIGWMAIMWLALTIILLSRRIEQLEKRIKRLKGHTATKTLAGEAPHSHDVLIYEDGGE